jgi:heterodisulfide reductase subunit A-like polyferredoxin
MKEVIVEQGLNRVVVAACTPKTHESIFMDTLREVGLNRYLFEMANIRNQSSWVHAADPAAATRKARDLVRMAVARAARLTPLVEKRIPVTPRALVVGGGVAGMNAALGLADQGFEVFLVEKEARLGGLAHRLHSTIEGATVAPYLAALIARVEEHPHIQVLKRALIVGFTGFKGNFTTEVLVGPGPYERKLEHGVVILATGATEYVPTEYGYGNGGGDRVVTQLELAERLASWEGPALENVVMIQCVGSRNADHVNCSRVCCQTAVKNAIHIKEDHPEARVVVLYRDIRTYGRLETYYRRARELGVLFSRFQAEEPPQVETQGDAVVVRFTDHVLRRGVEMEADLLVLSAGMRAADTQELASLVKLARTPEGHFMEAHVKLRPVDMATEGIFVCGTAHSPRLLSETIAQAWAAAARASTFLSQSELTLSAVTAAVSPDFCASCLVCVRSCPYEVPRMNADGKSEIDEALCHGCGVCAAECPGKAIHLNLYEDDQLLCKVEALLEDIR